MKAPGLANLDDARVFGIAHAIAHASGDDAAAERIERAVLALGDLLGDPLRVALVSGRASADTARTLARVERIGVALILANEAARMARAGED